MDLKALKLCARFALTPNQLGYCGSNSAPAKLQNCILKGDCKNVEKELKKFIILNPYLQTIGEITDLDPFSYEVIEAYWFGNELLKKCKPEHYNLLLDNFKIQGVPKFLIKELKEREPKAFIPIHLFNILYVGVGRASGSVPFNLNSINSCMIRWGTIIQKSKIKNQNYKIKIKLNSLEQIQNTVSFRTDPATGRKSDTESHSKSGRSMSDISISYNLKPVILPLSFNPKFTPNLKIGDTISVHWKFITKKLTQKETKNLTFWTKKLLNSI